MRVCYEAQCEVNDCFCVSSTRHGWLAKINDNFISVLQMGHWGAWTACKRHCATSHCARRYHTPCSDYDHYVGTNLANAKFKCNLKKKKKKTVLILMLCLDTVSTFM